MILVSRSDCGTVSTNKEAELHREAAYRIRLPLQKVDLAQKALLVVLELAQRHGVARASTSRLSRRRRRVRLRRTHT
jgi:hypothetical protein